jgi:molybdopterin-guanine dinucleotide biosynthesis protein A
MGGGDKSLRPLGGATILDHVVRVVEPQVEALLLNANGDPRRFARFGLDVRADSIEGFAGPLAGVLTGLEWAAARRLGCPWVVSVAADTPFLPSGLVPSLLAAVEREGAMLAVAASGGRNHPVIGLWPVLLAADLRRALAVEGVRRIDAWTTRFSHAVVSFPDRPVDPFFNVNDPDDLARAEAMVQAKA